MDRRGSLVVRIVEVDFQNGIVKLEASINRDRFDGPRQRPHSYRDPVGVAAAKLMLDARFELEIPMKDDG